MLKYLIKNHQWILGIIIGSILSPLLIFVIQSSLSQKRQTKEFYYTVPIEKVFQDTNDFKKAKCWYVSLSTHRRDAYRCGSDNLVIDPCFSPSNNGKIISCPSDPYKKPEYFKIDENDIPPIEDRESNEALEKQPWYIKLYDGSECRFITGATALVANMRIDYACSGKNNKALLLPLVEKDGLVRINCLTGGAVELCDIKEAWY